MEKVAIVTVNFNGSKDTLELLESLKKLSTKNLDLKIIVVDNGSTDDFVKTASKKYPEIDILQTGINLGFSGGYNRGITHAQIWGADYIMIINNDTEIISPNLLEQLIETAKSDERIGIVSPKIYFTKGYEYQKDKYKAEDLGKVIWYAGGTFDWNNVMSLHKGIDEVDNGEYSDTLEVDFISGCCMLIKKEVIEKVGLLDDRYFAYFEDTDYCKRAQASGFKLKYEGSVSISHKVSQSVGLGSPNSDYYGARNRMILGNTYASKRTKFALFREAIKLLLTGRPAQKQGIRDYFAGVTGPWKPQHWVEKADYQIKLSVISVNYNTPDLIDNLLKSLLPARHPELVSGSYEVIILDNGSEKGCADIVKKYDGVRFIQNETNTGFTGGNNKLFKFSRGQYILMLNSDIEAKENSLQNILAVAEHYKENAVVSGALYFPDGTLQDSAFYLPSISGAIKEYFLGLKGRFFMYAPKQDQRVEAAAMACFLIPRKILNTVGLLDERLFTYFEDVDFCRRLKKLNIPVYYTHKAKFTHLHGATSKTLKQGKSYELLQHAAKIYYGKNYYRALSFVLRVAQKISWVKTPVAR